jgi:hypothetical protein
MRKLLTTMALLVVVISAVGTAAATAGTQVNLRILHDGVAVEAAQVALYFSCDKVAGVTDADGTVALQASCNAGFYWVEVNGRRISELYQVSAQTSVIDLANVTYIVWQGGR